MKFNVEGLGKKQFSILQKLAPVVQQKDYYLGGGTALAIYFGHRTSVDLDWFTSKSVGDVMILAQSLRNANLDFLTEQTAHDRICIAGNARNTASKKYRDARKKSP